MVMRAVSSWGRLEQPMHTWVSLSQRAEAPRAVSSSVLSGLPFGNGRSYGDVCLNGGGVLWGTRGLDRLIAFDAHTGVIECEAGMTLQEVIDFALPRGWFLAVTPGSQFVTVGGAVANDVHGKNHHGQGTFGDHVERLSLLRTDGTRIDCGPDVRPQWFRATVAGLGLTGVILSVRFRLQRVAGPWIDATTTPFESLDEFYALSQAASRTAAYTVSWVDTSVGPGRVRGLFYSGNHSTSTQPAQARRVRTFAFVPGRSLINGASVRAFNAIYYAAGRRRRDVVRRHYLPFFYPLDNLLEWNRVYGKRGFYQYQCVVPARGQRESTQALLDLIANSGTGSFLAVLKTFGERPACGLLSFPMAGTTLALDFPNLGDRTRRLFDRLDGVVRDAGGRLYAAKDACMSSELYQRGYPRWIDFSSYRDPGISSQMSRRLFGS